MSVELPAGRVFVDTNVFVYAFDTSADEKRVRADELLEAIWKSGNGCVSVQILQEFYVNATRKGANPPSPHIVRRRISELGSWRVHEPRFEDVISAIDLHDEAQISFWDAMVLWSASKLGCETLLSEDLNHGQKIAGVEIINPFI